jgi:hypothetical protein
VLRLILSREVVALLSARSPKLTAALRNACKDGLQLLVLDGTLIACDRGWKGQWDGESSGEESGMSFPDESDQRLDVVPAVGKVFVQATVVYGAVMTLYVAVMMLWLSDWNADEVSWGMLVVPVVGGFVFGGLMALVATVGRFSLGSDGLTWHTRKGPVTIPAESLEGIGVLAGRARYRYLMVRFDPGGASGDMRPLAQFIKQGRRVTNSDGSLAIRARFLRPPPEEIRRYVESTGLVPWIGGGRGHHGGAGS